MNDTTSIFKNVMDELDSREQYPVEFAGFKYGTNSSRAADRRQQLLREYRENGFEPIAALPGAVFDELCDEFGLFRFEHLDEEGRTGTYLGDDDAEAQPWVVYFTIAAIATKSLPAAAVQKRGGALSSMLTDAGIAGFLQRQLQQHGDGTSYDGTLDALTDPQTALCIAATIGGVLGSVGVEFYDEYPSPSDEPYAFVTTVAKKLGISTYQLVLNLGVDLGIAALADAIGIERAMKATLRALPKRQRLRCHWPRRKDRSSQDGESVFVRFDVDPSSTFAETLDRLREREQTPSVAAVPKAIAVDDSEAIEGVAERIERGEYDPILYERHDRDVVILAQDGQFAPEQAVMEWAEQIGIDLLG